MRKKRTFLEKLCLAAGGLVLLFTSLAGAESEHNMMLAAKGNTAFACDLYAELRAQPGNLFFSPYSISTALAMTYAGARGRTAAQMAEVLHFMPKQHTVHEAFQELTRYFRDIQAAEAFALHIANALWLQQDFEVLEEFPDTLERYYAAKLFQVNFRKASEKVRKRINAWVAEQTRQKIQNLIPRGMITSLTRFVLTNAIYFKGVWKHPFDKQQTSDMPFWVAPDNQVRAAMMHQKTPLNYGETENLQVLEMPYTGQKLSMVILLPKAKDGLAELECQLNADQLDSWLATLERRDVEVYVPRFKMTRPLTLSSVLRAMGMTEAFSPNADFSGIEPNNSLFLSEVIHKAFVDVNEEGTEAAAATAVVGLTSAPEPTPVFKADHPFVFMIREQKTGSLLFLGRMTNPGE